jgi:hypothetical protein
MVRVLLLDERIRPDGTYARTWATSDGVRVDIRDDDEPGGALSIIAVDRVMVRYGRPLDQGVSLEGEFLACGAYRLRRLRYHAVVDSESRDYLVWEPPTGEPVACVATMVTAALRYLVFRLSVGPSSGI